MRLERVGSDTEKALLPSRSRYEEIDLSHSKLGTKERARSSSKDRVKQSSSSRSKQPIDYKKPLRLIQQANHIQVGTIKYSQEPGQQKVTKKFIPIFPFLYDDIKNGGCVQQAEFYLPAPAKSLIPLPPRE